MHPPIRQRSLKDLRKRSKIVFDLGKPFQEEILNLVQKESPSAVHDKVKEIAINRGRSLEDAILIARSARFLAIIFRDYGVAEFNKTIEEAKREEVLAGY